MKHTFIVMGIFIPGLIPETILPFLTPFSKNEKIAQVTTFDLTKNQGEQFTVHMNGELKHARSTNINSKTTDGKGIELSSHGSYNYKGEIYDIILFDDVLSEVEQISLVDYIKTKNNYDNRCEIQVIHLDM